MSVPPIGGSSNPQQPEDLPVKGNTLQHLGEFENVVNNKNSTHDEISSAFQTFQFSWNQDKQGLGPQDQEIISAVDKDMSNLTSDVQNNVPPEDL